MAPPASFEPWIQKHHLTPGLQFRSSERSVRLPFIRNAHTTVTVLGGAQGDRGLLAPIMRCRKSMARSALSRCSEYLAVYGDDDFGDRPIPKKPGSPRRCRRESREEGSPVAPLVSPHYFRGCSIEATADLIGSPGQRMSQEEGSAGHGLDSVPQPLAFCPSRYCTR